MICTRFLCSEDANFLDEDNNPICVKCLLDELSADKSIAIHYMLDGSYMGCDNDMEELIEKVAEHLDIEPIRRD